MKKEIKESFYKDFEIGQIVSKNDLNNFLKQFYPGIKESSLRWRIDDLKKKGYLAYKEMDTFLITDVNQFEKPSIEIDKSLLNDLMEFNKFISEVKKKNPSETEINISVWNTNLLNRYTTHQVYRNFTIIEVDDTRTESLFFALKPKYKMVIPSFRVKDLDHLIYDEQQIYLVTKLPKRSPLMNKKSKRNNYVSVPKMEKVLVDLLVYKKTILPYEEKEIVNIYKNIYKKYSINKSTILNYARNRGSKIRKEVEAMIELNEIKK